MMRKLFVSLVLAYSVFFGEYAMAAGKKPTIKVQQEKHGDRVFTMVRIAVPTIPNFQCDVWCYEDALGQGEGFPQPNGTMLLKHKHPKGAEVETKLVPSEGAIDWYVTVTGPTPDAVNAVRSVNGCWQFRRAPGFQSLKDKFVETFVNQCFIYTVRGFTFLKDTTRFPDTRRPANHKTNSPPWVQQYLPVWQRHTGQPEAFWGRSTDRPIYSITGIVSRDMKYLAAWGCKKSNGIGQGWHDCLHISPDMRLDYDAETNRTVSHFKMYFMKFDPLKLLQQYKKDFPPFEKSLRVELGDDKTTLKITSPDLPGNVVVLASDDNLTWSAMPWDTFEKRGPTTSMWAHPYDDFVELFVTIENPGADGREAKISSSLDLSAAPLFEDQVKEGETSVSSADGAWTVGIIWEKAEEPVARDGAISVKGIVGNIPPREQRTLRGRVYLIGGDRKAFEAKRLAILDEWRKAVPFKIKRSAPSDVK